MTPSRTKPGGRTRFDTTRRNILMATVLLLVAAGSSSAVGLLLTRGSGGSRNFDLIPRYINMWIVSPDDTLRLAVIYYPLDNRGLLNEETVQVAGPLLLTEADVLSSQTFGGELTSTEFLPGPDQDSLLIYPLFTLRRAAGPAPYGVDVLFQNAPYLTVDPQDPARRVLSMGAIPEAEPYYEQVIVAVALPPGATVDEIPDLQPYRNVRIGGWHVYYFDQSELTQASSLRIDYTPDPTVTVAPLDYWLIDLRR